MVGKKVKAQDLYNESEYIIDFREGERKYFALDEIESGWENITLYGSTYNRNKRTTIFFDDNIIKKVIYEEKIILEGETVYDELYMEFDTYILTRNRKLIIPKTDKGKEKNITSTNVINRAPEGCTFHIKLARKNRESNITCHNVSNNKVLPVTGCERIRNKEDFQEFVTEYIKTCPQDYFEKVQRVRKSHHVTIKYKPGDIFRAELDREHYAYGLILGKIRDIERWDELPEVHPFRHQMQQPIIYRLYDIVTKDSSLKSCDLAKIELLPMQIAVDNEIIWGTHLIVDRKILYEDDIDLPLYCRTIGSGEDGKFIIGWGFAVKKFPLSLYTDELNKLNNQYGTYLSLRFDYLEFKWNRESSKPLGISLQLENTKLKKVLRNLLNENEDFGMDEFNEKFGGLSRKEFARKIYENNK